MSAMVAAYGACAIEIHVTLDRAMGTDQAISIEKEEWKFYVVFVNLKRRFAMKRKLPRK